MNEDELMDFGIAFTEENFDQDFLGEGIECDGDFEGCIYGDDASKYCQCYADCKKEYDSYV